MQKLCALRGGFVLLVIFCGSHLVAGDELCPSEPNECDCQINSGLVSLDCSGKELTTLPSIRSIQSAVHSIDVTNNQLNEFPKFDEAVPLLSTLDLTDNKIHQIPENALHLLPSLRFLYINNNHIANWADIRPNTVLQSAPNLETLSLSGNLLTSLTSIDQSFVLTSHSLKILDLSDCKITKVTGQFVLQGLPKLEHLILSGNPLRSISDIISDNLLSLDLSNCKLTFLQPTVFVRLPSLTYVNLSRNQRLSLTRKTDEYVQSESLKRIDLSLCNMDGIELSGFPNLMTAILRGNLIARIKRDSFEKNVALENIDMSSNSITHISSTSFRALKLLKHLDLSYNMIRRIERETFKDNDVLTSINLSRNYVERFNRISAKSLTHLNMSWCEVLAIDLDAFNDMPELVELDLSNNLFSEFPATLQSDTLQTLDLSMCRISTIRNNTFQGFPELSGINLAGNRFTTMFRTEFFGENPYLRDIWMGDNPWRCECEEKPFYNFFVYVNDHPAKLNDYAQLRCHSPDELYGLTWDMACAEIWYAESRQSIGTAQKVWTGLMVTIVVLAGVVCLITAVKRCVQSAKRARMEEERIQNLDESREIMRRNRSMLDQEAQLNAPDPRETRPPCYEDAILLPRLNGSFTSLRKIKSDNDVDEPDSFMSRRNRSRSEEVLSVRDSTLDETRLTRRQIIAEANNRISIYPVVEIPPRHLIEQAEVTIESTRDREQLQTLSVAARNNVIDPAEVTVTTTQNLPIKIFDSSQSSPYAQRKSVSGTSASNTPDGRLIDEINIVDDHYSRGQLTSSGSSIDSISMYTVIN